MPQAGFRPFLMAICAILSLPLAGCGYHFQEAHNPLLDLGIHKIYVKNFTNHTYRPGLEHYFTTAMVREIGRSKSFELVNSETDSDAVLGGIVLTADESVNAPSTITVPNGRTVSPASAYNASVSCQVTLQDRRGRQIFTQSVSGTKEHPGTAALGDLGATAPLTNDSEQRLAVQFLADQMMASVYQRMVDTF